MSIPLLANTTMTFMRESCFCGWNILPSIQLTSPHRPCPPHTTEKKLVTKIDLHVIPVLCVLYLLAFLDRVNISNANVFGLSEDLSLEGNEYNTALVIFFVPYVLLEIPSNVLLKRFTPHVWLSLNMALFGLVTFAQGFVKNYSGLLATRCEYAAEGFLSVYVVA